jgi:hypothetical protein
VRPHTAPIFQLKNGKQLGRVTYPIEIVNASELPVTGVATVVELLLPAFHGIPRRLDDDLLSVLLPGNTHRLNVDVVLAMDAQGVTDDGLESHIVSMRFTFFDSAGRHWRRNNSQALDALPTD